MEYTDKFSNAVKYAKQKNLFLGSGNPNGKILIIGKEHYFHHNHKENTKEFYEEIIRSRKIENTNNVLSWENNIKNNFTPDWSHNEDFSHDNSNALTA